MAKYMTSRFYIKENTIQLITGTLLFTDLLIIRECTIPIVDTIRPYFYLLLFICTLFYLLIKSYNNGLQIEAMIESLEKEIKIKMNCEYYFDLKEERNTLNKLKTAHEKITCRYKYIHFLKTRKELMNESTNAENFILIIVLYFIISSYVVDYPQLRETIFHIIDIVFWPAVGLILILGIISIIVIKRKTFQAVLIPLKYIIRKVKKWLFKKGFAKKAIIEFNFINVEIEVLNNQIKEVEASSVLEIVKLIKIDQINDLITAKKQRIIDIVNGK